MSESQATKADAVAQAFTLAAKRQQYLQVEAALAEAQASLGMIPPEAAEAITGTARSLELDADAVAARMAVHGHPMMALVEVLADAVGEHGGWVHWGATTQNIQQTGDVLMLRDVHGLIVSQLRGVLDALADLGERTAATPMAGRTHWQHAVPITFGLKVAAWTDQLLRHLERLEQLAPRLLRSMTGGAAGSFASFGDRGIDLQNEVARLLDLEPMAVPSRAIVDHFAELVLTLGLLATTVQTIADEMQRLNTPEYGEVQETIPPGQVGSSTMPQKRIAPHLGPIIIACAQARAATSLAYDGMLQAHEVDGSRSVIMDRALEQACVATVAALDGLDALVRGLRVFPERMRENLGMTGGLINAEAVMLALADAMGRQEAHHAVHSAVEAVNADGIPFGDALLADEHVARVMSREDIERLVDPEQYTGLSERVARETAARARAAARG